MQFEIGGPGCALAQILEESNRFPPRFFKPGFFVGRSSSRFACKADHLSHERHGFLVTGSNREPSKGRSATGIGGKVNAIPLFFRVNCGKRVWNPGEMTTLFADFSAWFKRGRCLG